MKVSYLHIRNYKQFSNLELDLTYPKGHPKAGKPLDKICIIGQSGTGKTNLLDIIKKSTIDFSEQPENSYLPFSEFVGKDTDDKYITTKVISKDTFIAETVFTEKSSQIVWTPLDFLILAEEKIYHIGTDKSIQYSESRSFNEKLMSRTDKSVLEGLERQRNTITSMGISHYRGEENFRDELSQVDESIEKLKNKYSVSSAINTLKSQNFINRSIVEINDNTTSIWAIMKDKIDLYNTELLQVKDILTNKLLEEDVYDKKDFKSDLESWKKDNENLLEKIADDLNFILNKFNLKLTNIDENKNSYNALKIEDLSNKEILDYDDLSTGTKNLIATFIPLKIYKPQDSIILIDEPEMSFYPNIQRQLTDLYMEVGENNQLIMATHSPLIASSFEPWEVVELKFDKDNQIYREKYYEGDDNHVDNYTIDPRMLTWTGILTDIFDLQEDSNFSFREKKLMEYATLKAEIKAMEDKKSEKATIKIAQFKKLSSLLGLQN